jgi:hypothetical protein
LLFKLAFESFKSRFGFLAKFLVRQSQVFSRRQFSKSGVFKKWLLSFLSKFQFRLCQVSAQPPVGKIGFKVFSQSLASKPFHFAKSVFLACVLFSQVRFSKSATFFQQKFWQVWFGYFRQVHFFWQVCFLAKSVFSKGFGKF